MSWVEHAVIYQVYPRSFHDASGDGVGDLAGIERRLDHIAALGAAALWLSPVYPSPGVDMGYDIADFRDVDPLFGDLAALDRLVESAHERDLRVLLDLVPCHTSIEHPWFTEHPDYYVWADGDAPAEQLGGQLRRPGLDPAPGAAGAGTCTATTPRCPTWTGATRTWWRPCRTWCGSGWTAASTGSAWTPSRG